ncbi:MAG: hypothetical protein KGL67_03175 [Patescibacteria group bacterium]|nr:hypothetical protein [Patescibacteria group bacterium]
MEKFNWTKALGFGALIWLIMFALVSAFVGFNIYEALLSKIIFVLAAGLLSYLCVRNVKTASLGRAFEYGLTWVAVGVVLDLLVSMQFNPTMLLAWEYWVSYAFILFVPMFYSGFGTTKNVNALHA